MTDTDRSSVSRKAFLTLSGAAAATIALPRSPFAQETKPLLSRIKMATIGAPSLDAVERWDTKWLRYPWP